MNDIERYNDKGQPQGLWEMYWSNDDSSFKCFFHNSKKVGYSEWYTYNCDGNGKLREKKYYL
jgi:hypothetical protein